MALTADQQNEIKTVLDKHLNACPVCHANTWTLGPDVTFLPTMQGTNINLGLGQPCVSAICNVCGGVQLFNVFLTGLAEKLGIKATAISNPDTPNG